MGYTEISIAVGVAYLVLHVCGNSCPRYPASTCHGPFTIRPSNPVKYPHGPILNCDTDVMESCLKQCMGDLCCRAFGMEDGNCTMVNFHTEAYDFVKEAHVWPMQASSCLNTTGCAMTIGGNGGYAFSLHQTFLDAASDLRAIRGQFDEDNFLVKIEVDYGNGYVASRKTQPGMESFSCELAPGEHITGVTGYMDYFSFLTAAFKGIKFTTSLKTCGPYGEITNMQSTVTGQMLLSVKGRSGAYFDNLQFIFKKCLYSLEDD